MKKFSATLVLISTFIFGISLNSFSETIIVYAPESMKWIESTMGKDFKEKTGNDIKFVGIKALVTRVALEKKNPKSDVILGLTAVSGELAKSQNLLRKYVPKNISLIKNPNFILDKDGYITSFDYGLMGINYNKKLLKKVPKNFDDVQKLNKQLLVQDPRSATGQEIMLWTIALYGDKWLDFWKNLQPAILTVTSDWDDSFAKFQTGEAPMMFGYATSNAFFYSEPNSNFDSFIPSDGGYIYLEGAALTERKNIKPAAEEFIEYLLTPSAQDLLVKNNYMLPVTDIKLEYAFAKIPTTKKVLTLEGKDISKNLETWKQQLLDLLSK
ncbi:MAG: thiamine ABC transporter substrate-binding protein [Fusobacteriaceae bacterium]